jgi:bacterioferritin
MNYIGVFMGNSGKNKEILDLMGKIYECEMAGIHRYLHYSFMIIGPNRIPIQKWFRNNASESMTHAIEIGEKITSLGGHPPMVSSAVTESNIHTVQQFLEESLKHEEDVLVLYVKLVALAVKHQDIALEELARGYVRMETEHSDEVRKMLRKPEVVA